MAGDGSSLRTQVDSGLREQLGLLLGPILASVTGVVSRPV